MGLPGFFSWILKRYARNILKTNLNVRPKYLYIDANCLFHPVCFKILEEYSSENIASLELKMFQRICEYLDYIEEYVNPTDMMYIAVDGSTPLAKIIQQRKRRYKSELDTSLKNELKQKFGMQVCNIWNNTSITPGTQFMENLHVYLDKYYSQKKSHIKYIYSSYHTPGEGEHKIMGHIREIQSLDDQIVVYGLDADLIFLTMASGKKNIHLIREKMEFEKTECEKEMIYVSIKETKLAYSKELRQIIFSRKVYNTDKSGLENLGNINFADDFIFLCFLLGNDFVPHFPSVDIHSGGLDELIASYVDVLFKLYAPLIKVNQTNVYINTDFFQMICEDMGNKESNYFKNTLYETMNKTINKKCREDKQDIYKQELWNLENLKAVNNDITKYNPIQLGMGEKNVWKYRYYEYYFHTSGDQHEIINSLCENYINGVKWITEYYFNKCPDWRWNYIQYYAPFISDIAGYIKSYNVNMNDIKFNNNKYIPIMVQLVSVIPPSCSYLLPKTYQYLITTYESPIIDMFPSKIKIDTLYKGQLWQCVPRIPYLDINRILNVTENLVLSKEEDIRNKIYENFVY